MIRISNKRQLASSVSIIAAATALSFASPALGQTATSTLRGRAAPGSQIVAKEISTGITRTATAAADGTYNINGLQGGTYRVTAGANAADVVVPVASTQVQDFDVPAATQGQVVAAPGKNASSGTSAANAPNGAIVVTGTRPTAEVRTSQVNQFVTLHDIAALPQTTRNFLEFANTVPGVQFQVDAKHNTSLRGGAQLASAVNVYIDGVSQKDLVGGGSGITGSAGPNGNGDPGNPFPQLAIAEYKVMTSNYSAEYGDATSSVIVAQTKSGTNRFQGEAFGTFTNEKLRAKTVTEKATHASKGKEPSKEYGAAISGPIVKDHAHFFLTWEHKSLSNQASVYPDGVSIAAATALLPADVAKEFGSITNPFTENLYFGKIDVEPTTNDRIELAGKLRKENTVSGGGGQAAASTRAPYVNNDKRADIRWEHNANEWTNQARLSYQNTNASSLQTDATPQIQYKYFPDPTNISVSHPLIQVGGPGLGVGAVSRQRGWTLQNDFVYTGLHWMGDHSIKVGGSIASIKLKTQNASSNLGNATYYYAVTPGGGVYPTPYEVQFPNLTAGINAASVTTTDKQYNAYIQDDWNVNRKLTVNLGVRWDHEVVPAYLDYVTPQRVVNGVNAFFPGTTQSYASVLAQGGGNTPGYNIFDYISTGKNRKAPNNFSPRLGFSYDINGDNRHVIFGGYARAYSRNQFGTLALEITKIALNNNPEVYFPTPYTFDSFSPTNCRTAADINPAQHCYAFDPKYLTPEGLAQLTTNPTSGEVDLLNNKLRTPHSDQFSLGMRNKVGDWNTQATVSLIKGYDGVVGRFGSRYANGAYFQNGSQWGAQGIPGVGTPILFENGGKDRNFQVGLAAQKPYTLQSGWSATVSYTFSASKQNNVAGGSNPYSINNNQYLFDLPYANEYPFIRGTAVPRHRIVATYTRDLFWGISMASKLELATPTYAATIFGCAPGVQVCNAYGGSTEFYSERPHKTFGYKDVDLQFTKNFNVTRTSDAYVRVDILNLFNFKNYDPGAIYYPVYRDPRAVYNKATFVGTPFTVKLSAGLRFGLAPPVVPVAEPIVPPPPPATQTCADGSVVAVGATCPVAAPPAPPPPAPVQRGQRGQ